MSTSDLRRGRGRVGATSRLLAVALATLALTACGDSPVELEVIEEITFDASLDIDLADFTELPSGVYIQDVTEGTGDVIQVGSAYTMSYVGWLRTGVEFDAGTASFVYGGSAIPGWELGIQGMLEGGVRRLIIPPELAYGEEGSGAVPGGAVLIFRVQLIVVG
jgi:hypothetical protein